MTLLPSRAVALALAAVAAARAQSGPDDAALHLLAPATVAQFDAHCLDGSPGGYYIRRASSPAASTKWKIHIQG